MLPRTFIFISVVSCLIIYVHRINSYKTRDELKKQYQKIENDAFSTSDVLVGKAMDFIYSNKTVMGLIARELWNVGSRAIDKIVEAKGEFIL